MLLFLCTLNYFPCFGIAFCFWQYKWTALHVASLHGNEEVVELLISSGSDLNAQNIVGALTVFENNSSYSALNFVLLSFEEGFVFDCHWLMLHGCMISV